MTCFWSNSLVIFPLLIKYNMKTDNTQHYITLEHQTRKQVYLAKGISCISCIRIDSNDTFIRGNTNAARPHPPFHSLIWHCPSCEYIRGPVCSSQVRREQASMFWFISLPDIKYLPICTNIESSTVSHLPSTPDKFRANITEVV